MGYMTDGLTFNTLREANIRRLALFKNKHGQPAHSQPDGSDWSDAEWLEAMVGEVGEYANLRKKYRRGDLTEEEFKIQAEKELADVCIYLDLLAFRLGINLGNAVMSKWNETCEKLDINMYIDAEDWHYRRNPNE